MRSRDHAVSSSVHQAAFEVAFARNCDRDNQQPHSPVHDHRVERGLAALSIDKLQSAINWLLTTHLVRLVAPADTAMALVALTAADSLLDAVESAAAFVENCLPPGSSGVREVPCVDDQGNGRKGLRDKDGQDGEAKKSHVCRRRRFSRMS